MSSSSNTPCAACKCLRRKCTVECVFAPYFPPDDPQKFTNVHRVFGASNVTKILNELHPSQRADTVCSLAYEATHRIQDPVFGCLKVASFLREQLRQLHIALENAKNELATYIGPSAFLPPILNQTGVMAQQLVGPSSQMMPACNNVVQPTMMTGAQHDHSSMSQQQQILEAQLAAMREHDVLRKFEQHHIHENELLRYSGNNNLGFGEVGGNDTNGVTLAVGFNQMPMQSPSSALASNGSYDHQQLPSYLYNNNNNNNNQIQQQQCTGNQELLQLDQLHHQQSDQELLLLDQHQQINNVGIHNQQLLQLPQQMQLRSAKGEDNQSC